MQNAILKNRRGSQTIWISTLYQCGMFVCSPTGTEATSRRSSIMSVEPTATARTPSARYLIILSHCLMLMEILRHNNGRIIVYTQYWRKHHKITMLDVLLLFHVFVGLVFFVVVPFICFEAPSLCCACEGGGGVCLNVNHSRSMYSKSFASYYQLLFQGSCRAPQDSFVSTILTLLKVGYSSYTCVR